MMKVEPEAKACKGPEAEDLSLSLYFMVAHQLEEENSKYICRLPYTQKASIV